MTEKETTPRILLVDDEEDILEFVSYNLEREGFKVFTGRNGREAIQMVTKVKPDLVILDVMMPEMDGIAACEEIRKIPGLPQCSHRFPDSTWRKIIPKLQVLMPVPMIISPNQFDLRCLLAG